MRPLGDGRNPLVSDGAMGVVGTVRSGQMSRPGQVLAMIGRECRYWPIGARALTAPVHAGAASCFRVRSALQIRCSPRAGSQDTWSGRARRSSLVIYKSKSRASSVRRLPGRTAGVVRTRAESSRSAAWWGNWSSAPISSRLCWSNLSSLGVSAARLTAEGVAQEPPTFLDVCVHRDAHTEVPEVQTRGDVQWIGCHRRGPVVVEGESHGECRLIPSAFTARKRPVSNSVTSFRSRRPWWR